MRIRTIPGAAQFFVNQNSYMYLEFVLLYFAGLNCLEWETKVKIRENVYFSVEKREASLYGKRLSILCVEKNHGNKVAPGNFCQYLINIFRSNSLVTPEKKDEIYSSIFDFRMTQKFESELIFFFSLYLTIINSN